MIISSVKSTFPITFETMLQHNIYRFSFWDEGIRSFKNDLVLRNCNKRRDNRYSRKGRMSFSLR